MGKDSDIVDEPMEEEEEEEDGSDSEFQCDYSAYVLFHEGQTGAPCLSFDILKDNLGDNRSCKKKPASLTFVSGSQAEAIHSNNIVVLKIENLKPIDHTLQDEVNVAETDAPVITSVSAKHDGCVNRIRASTHNNMSLAASWSETGRVHIWDLNPLLEAVSDENSLEAFNNRESYKPLFTFEGHKNEGFAVDWSAPMPGTLASGDCNNGLHVWKPGEAGHWSVNQRSFVGHTASVEDVQWSPNEANVLASCSVDKSIRIWDTRAQPDKACQLTVKDAHTSDINVINWNSNEPLIASGGDDGVVLVWDLRKLQTQTPIAQLKYHNAPITSVEWHNTDSSVLATGGEDDQVLQWDLAVEKDDQENPTEDADTPDQLLFIHKGQKEVKEIHWHPQIPGLIISTAHSGFNIFKTISC